MSHNDDFPRIAKPCAGCPWRTQKDSGDIPSFSLELAESLASTSPGKHQPLRARIRPQSHGQHVCLPPVQAW